MYANTDLLEKSLRALIAAMPLIPNNEKRIGLFEGFDYRFTFWWSRLNRECRNNIWLKTYLNILCQRLVEESVVRQIKFVFDATLNRPDQYEDGDRPTRIAVYFELHHVAELYNFHVTKMDDEQLELLSTACRMGNYRTALYDILHPPRPRQDYEEDDEQASEESVEERMGSVEDKLVTIGPASFNVPNLDRKQISMLAIMQAFSNYFPLMYDANGIAYRDSEIGGVQRSLYDLKLVDVLENKDNPVDTHIRLTQFGAAVAKHYTSIQVSTRTA